MAGRRHRLREPALHSLAARDRKIAVPRYRLQGRTVLAVPERASVQPLRGVAADVDLGEPGVARRPLRARLSRLRAGVRAIHGHLRRAGAARGLQLLAVHGHRELQLRLSLHLRADPRDAARRDDDRRAGRGGAGRSARRGGAHRDMSRRALSHEGGAFRARGVRGCARPRARRVECWGRRGRARGRDRPRCGAPADRRYAAVPRRAHAVGACVEGGRGQLGSSARRRPLLQVLPRRHGNGRSGGQRALEPRPVRRRRRRCRRGCRRHLGGARAHCRPASGGRPLPVSPSPWC